MALIRRRRDATPRRSEVAVTRPNPWLAAEGENGPASEEPRRRCAWLHHGSDVSRTPSTSHPTPNTRLWRDRRHPMAGSPQIVLTAQGLSTGRRRLTRGGRAAPARRQPPPNRKTMQVERTVWQNLSLTPRVPYKGWGEGHSPSLDNAIEMPVTPSPPPSPREERGEGAHRVRGNAVGYFNDALFATSAHFAISLRRNAASASGVPPT